MSRAVLCAALVLFASSNVSAKEWARKMFEDTSHDFGNVARGAKVQYEFVLKNIYQEDIHISGVRSSCGCTTPKVLNETLKTYEKGAILATFNTHTFSGSRSATLTVTIDKPFHAEVQLQVKGYIRTDIVLDPGGVDLGAVDQGTAVDKKIRITYAGRGNWKILEARPANDYLEATIVETGRKSGEANYELQVRLKDDAPAGFIKEQITLITNDKNAEEVPVEVTGRIVSELTVSPATLFLGSVKSGSKATKQIVVKGKRPFKIVNVTCDEPGFEFKLPEAAKPVHVIPVTFNADGEAGKRDYKIHVETDLGDGLSQDVQCFVQVVGAPQQTNNAENHTAAN